MTSTKSLEPTHLKFVARFDSLTDLTIYAKEILKIFDQYEQEGLKRNSNAKKGKKKTATSSSRVPKFGEFWADSNKSEYVSTQSIISQLDEMYSNVFSLQERYFDIVSPILSQYYSVEGNYESNTFYQLLISENITDRMDRLQGNIRSIVSSFENYSNFYTTINKIKGINTIVLKNHKLDDMSPFYDAEDSVFQGINNQILAKLTCQNTFRKFLSLYEENKPDLPNLQTKNHDVCPECEETLVLFSEESEKRCDKCGYIENLPGTLFEDSQFYNQQITCAKHKKHNPSAHCAKWLYQIQAKENKTISPEAIEKINQKAVKDYTRMGVKRSMNDMKCRQVRQWLKIVRLPKLNNHAPLIRKMITGLNGNPISPPQLSSEEEQQVLCDFSMAVEVFEKLSKREDVLRIFNKSVISNKLYYPFFLLKILAHRLKGNPKLPKLIECIHLQSSTTLTKDDRLWKKMCKEMGGYKYEPTDRTMLIDIF
jgi:ribosomal protein S27AE